MTRQMMWFYTQPHQGLAEQIVLPIQLQMQLEMQQRLL